MIQVQGLCKRFLDYQRGWKTAITDISFECQPGAIFGLLGPNGAGKTTTLRILSTVLKPTGGRAVVAGHDVLDRSGGGAGEHRLHVGQHGIYDRMTAWELVEYFGRLYGMSRERLRERMEDIFDWLQMNDFRDVLGSKMSTGHEAEGLDRPDDRPRSAGLDLRRADFGAGCPGGPGGASEHSRAAGPGQDDRLFHALDARGREALLAGGDHPQGAGPGRGRARTSCSSSLTSRIWKSYSSTWSSAPIQASTKAGPEAWAAGELDGAQHRPVALDQ